MYFILIALLIYCFVTIVYWDFRWLIIPDKVSVLILVGGVLAQGRDGVAALVAALAFGVFIGFVMWSIRFIHFKLTGRIGLGLGDVKLVAASATWLSPIIFPFYLFVASGLALIFLTTMLLLRSIQSTQRIPFGPFLAGSLIVSWTFEAELSTLLGSIP